MAEKIVLKIVDDEFTQKLYDVFSYKDHKAWIARVDGEDPKWAFAKTFLNTVRNGRRTYYPLADFVDDMYYHVRVSERDAHPDSPHLINEYFKCKVQKTQVTLTPVEYQEVKASVVPEGSAAAIIESIIVHSTATAGLMNALIAAVGKEEANVQLKQGLPEGQTLHLISPS